MISEMQFTVLNMFLFCTVIKYNDQRQKVNILAYSPSDTECIIERKAWHDQPELEAETAYFIHTQEAQSESFQEVQQGFTPLHS